MLRPLLFLLLVSVPVWADEPWQHLNDYVVRRVIEGAQFHGNRLTYRFDTQGAENVTETVARRKRDGVSIVMSSVFRATISLPQTNLNVTRYSSGAESCAYCKTDMSCCPNMLLLA